MGTGPEPASSRGRGGPWGRGWVTLPSPGCTRCHTQGGRRSAEPMGVCGACGAGRQCLGVPSRPPARWDLFPGHGGHGLEPGSSGHHLPSWPRALARRQGPLTSQAWAGPWWPSSPTQPPRTPGQSPTFSWARGASLGPPVVLPQPQEPGASDGPFPSDVTGSAQPLAHPGLLPPQALHPSQLQPGSGKGGVSQREGHMRWGGAPRRGSRGRHHHAWTDDAPGSLSSSPQRRPQRPGPHWPPAATPTAPAGPPGLTLGRDTGQTTPCSSPCPTPT